MKISDILDKLGEILNGGAEAAEVAQEAIDISNQYKAGQLSQSEYQELIADIQEERLVIISAGQLTLKDDLNALFNDIESAISILPI